MSLSELLKKTGAAVADDADTGQARDETSPTVPKPGTTKPTERGGLAALMQALGDEEPAPRQSTARNAINQAGQGALDQGLYSGLEGVARIADQLDRRNDTERARGAQWQGLQRTLGELQRSEAQSPHPTRREQIAKIRESLAGI